jgi:hypothetical protein
MSLFLLHTILFFLLHERPVKTPTPVCGRCEVVVR